MSAPPIVSSFSRTVTSRPSKDRKYAAVSPAGPAPITATRPSRGPFQTGGVPTSFTSSLAKRFRLRIATASSRSARRQNVSQGWSHARPHTDGNGFRRRIVSRASAGRPSLIRATYSGTLTWAGQAATQLVPTIFLQEFAAQRLSTMCATYSWRKWRMVDRTGFAAVWPSPHSDPSLTALPSLSSRSMSSNSPSPSVIRRRMSYICLVPIRQGAHLPQDSSFTNSVKNRAISTMQIDSSITTRPPEPMIAPASLTES